MHCFHEGFTWCDVVDEPSITIVPAFRGQGEDWRICAEVISKFAESSRWGTAEGNYVIPICITLLVYADIDILEQSASAVPIIF